ncbi:14363_t:CDS:2, partial [Gigaspora margarita]
NYYSFVDFESSKEYIDSDSSSDQSSNNFIELVNPDKINEIIDRLAVLSFKKSVQPLAIDSNKSNEDLQTAKTVTEVVSSGCGLQDALESTAIYISNFLTETIGQLKDDQEKACVVMMNIGTLENFSNKLNRHWIFFEQIHPGYIGIFAFNNAISHKAFAKDTLVALKMNFSLEKSVSKI